MDLEDQINTLFSSMSCTSVLFKSDDAADADADADADLVSGSVESRNGTDGAKELRFQAEAIYPRLTSVIEAYVLTLFASCHKLHFPSDSFHRCSTSTRSELPTTLKSVYKFFVEA